MANTLFVQEVGHIKEIKKSIAKVSGLTRCINGQILHINDKTRGIVIGFVKGEVYVFLLGNIEEAKVGSEVYSLMEPFTIPVGEGFLGRIVNALAEPIDNKGFIVNRKDESGREITYPIFRKAPGVLQRVPLKETFQTGVLIIDSTIPIGKGQRELIIGDRMTGKTTICVDSILNQKGKDVICIYCCIGRAYSSLQKVIEVFKEHDALDYTIVVAAHAANSSGEQYLAPYTAATLGEYFMDRGKDVFVVFDDLTKHAWAYRQLSLLLERSPGRDAYPGDIFYLHSQLMERAGKYSPEYKSGSMTFFPIVDTIQGEVTGYIPSNLISMTDGQIYLNTALFNSGVRPAIDLGLSVSRIGNKVQSSAMKELSGKLRLEYVRYNELLKLTRFKASVTDEVFERLREGSVITTLFTQRPNRPYTLDEELIFLYALRRKVLNILSKEDIVQFMLKIYGFIKARFPRIVNALADKKELLPAVKQELDQAFIAFFKARDNKEI